MESDRMIKNWNTHTHHMGSHLQCATLSQGFWNWKLASPSSLHPTQDLSMPPMSPWIQNCHPALNESQTTGITDKQGKIASKTALNTSQGLISTAP